MKRQTSELDKAINKLKPGQFLVLSQVGDCINQVERTGDGKRLNFVRISESGFEVYRSVRF